MKETLQEHMDIINCLKKLDPVHGDPKRNARNAETAIRKTAEGKPDVTLLPVMGNPSYSLENVRDIADVDGQKTRSIISPLAKEYGVNIVAGSVANLYGDNVYNTLYVFDRHGDTVAEYSKIHLFRLMEEHRYLVGGSSLCNFNLDGQPCGAVICYDIRFPEIIRSLALRGCRSLFVPAQWPRPRIDHWRKLLMARAMENRMYVVACDVEMKESFRR